jgi:hypothetical protein
VDFANVTETVGLVGWPEETTPVVALPLSSFQFCFVTELLGEVTATRAAIAAWCCWAAAI